MSIVINSHQFTGKVIHKSGPYTIKEDMAKRYLFCRGTYYISGKEREQEIRVTCFSWGDNKSKISDVFPGDEVSFTFNLSGKFNPDKKDYLGCPSCWTECVLSSKVEILSTQNRTLYDNKPGDGLNLPDIEPPKFQYKDGLQFDNLEDDDATKDLPF
jgi:hypothetical protein